MAGVGVDREVCAWVLLISGSPWRAQSSAYRALIDVSWHYSGPWPIHFVFAGHGALTLSLFCSDPSAYTEPYKVCPISAVTPKEDLTSDEEQGSSEEEDSTARDPSLTHKVG